jgi:hypothetical protein
MSAFLQKFRAFLGSHVFYILILAVFALQSLWIAFSAVYPQAFDEDFHFGLIRVYSQYWLPFLGGQPEGGNAYGAVARDPSFLYHYLMSFPYRLIQLLTDNQAIQVLSLRVINVALFGLGLILFRKLLLRVGVSRRLTNLTLFVVTFIPIVPQLAGQINYDNLLMPVAAVAMLLTVGLIDQIRQHRFSLQAIITLLAVCLAATQVKYEFVPIFAGIVLFLAVLLWREYRGRWPKLKELWSTYAKHPWLPKVLALLLLAATLSMFVQRDAVNVLKYHNVAPDCGYILPIEACSQYPVWIHDYVSHQQVLGHNVAVGSNPVWYLWEWTYWLWYRLFFAINGPTHGFTNYPPLPLPSAIFGLLIVSSVIAIVIYRKLLFRGRPYFVFLGAVVGLYLLALLSQGFLKYRHTAVLELMNGRYLLPILLPAMAIGGTALGHALANYPRIKVVAAAIVVVCMLQGGGAFTFISRSDPTWYWDNRAVRNFNNAAQHVVHPLVFDGSKTYSTRKWFFN